MSWHLHLRVSQMRVCCKQDFGLATKSKTAVDACGTVQWMAPEVSLSPLPPHPTLPLPPPSPPNPPSHTLSLSNSLSTPLAYPTLPLCVIHTHTHTHTHKHTHAHTHLITHTHAHTHAWALTFEGHVCTGLGLGFRV
jgi:hypothetical protein